MTLQVNYYKSLLFTVGISNLIQADVFASLLHFLGIGISSRPPMYLCPESQFLDCISIADLIADATCLLLALLVFKRGITKRDQLKQFDLDDAEPELKNSLWRRLLMNKLALIYLFLFANSVVFSIILFIIYTRKRKLILQYHLNVWYKVFEALFINYMNMLYVCTGLLYWAAMRGYYQLSGKQIPLVYRSWGKWAFALGAAINIGVFMGIFVMAATMTSQFDGVLTERLNIVSVLVSLILCSCAKILYAVQIRNQFTISLVDSYKESLTTMMVIVCSGTRIMLSASYDNQERMEDKLRSLNNECMDTNFTHAIIMVFISFILDTLPAACIIEVFASSNTQANSQTPSITNYQSIE